MKNGSWNTTERDVDHEQTTHKGSSEQLPDGLKGTYFSKNAIVGAFLRDWGQICERREIVFEIDKKKLLAKGPDLEEFVAGRKKRYTTYYKRLYDLWWTLW